MITRIARRLTTTRLMTTDAKINQIVTDISQLNLLQTSQLVNQLKITLNIQDIAAPVASQPQQTQQTAEPVEKQAEQTSFKITLSKIDAAQKAKMIKEIKQLIPGANLVEAKKFVESVPKVIKEGVEKEEAMKLKKLLESIGGVVLLE